MAKRNSGGGGSTGTIVLGLGAAAGAWWLWGKYGGDITAALPGNSIPSTPGTTPIQSNGVPATQSPAVTQGANNTPANPPAPTQANNTTPAPAVSQPVVPPQGYATLDPANKPNFSQWVATHVGPGRQSFTADQWNYYFSDFSGIPQTADLFDPANRQSPMSVTDYMGRRTAAGLSGLRGLTGFSAPVPFVRNRPGNYILRGGVR